MNVVDTSGWLAFFFDEPEATVFAPLIEDTETLVVPAICLSEVFKKVLQVADEARALKAVAHMRQGTIVPIDEPLSLDAARLGVELRLPLADSLILATARAAGATVWTGDTHFEGLAGVRYVPKTAP
jgi:predicted nucleic acid-binding protein